MAVSSCYLFKNSLEYVPMSDITKAVPAGVRGVYVLYDFSDGKNYNVVYVGMSRGERYTIGSRLLAHKRKKANLWTHFSLYEVWDNITAAQVEELEGFFRHVYAKDAVANQLNKQKRSTTLAKIKRTDEWLHSTFGPRGKLGGSTASDVIHPRSSRDRAKTTKERPSQVRKK
jgi:hypothetical protein